jgi:RNA polymerase sigma-70 factor (ECF subfamily)
MLMFQAGDEGAFVKLIERNQARVYGVIHRFLGRNADVDDLVQEVFLRVFRTALRYSPTAKFSTWLYRIAANLSLNAIRSRGKIHLSQLDTPGDEASDGFQREVEDPTAAQPHAAMASRELAGAVEIAIAKLPVNQRVALILNKYEQMNYEDVARIMRCSTMAVKSLLSRARCNLRQSLSQHLKEGDG